jgi:hypothetical protein
MLKLAKEFTRQVNNNHVRVKICKNIMPRLYKEVGKKEKDRKAFSPYIVKK